MNTYITNLNHFIWRGSDNKNVTTIICQQLCNTVDISGFSYFVLKVHLEKHLQNNLENIKTSQGLSVTFCNKTPSSCSLLIRALNKLCSHVRLQKNTTVASCRFITFDNDKL